MKLFIILSISCSSYASIYVSAFSPCHSKRNSRVLDTLRAVDPMASSASSSEHNIRGDYGSADYSSNPDPSVTASLTAIIDPTLSKTSSYSDDRIIINTNKNRVPSAAAGTNKSSQAAAIVNSATLQFNNRLNRMSKNFDATTAIKVEASLLDAVRKYQLANEVVVKQGNNYDDNTEPIMAQKNLAKQQLTTMITPNTISFTNAITAWARCTRKDSPKRAQALLDQMHTLYEEYGWEHVKPNKITYNSVITAWTRSRENGGLSARHAEALLRKMYDLYNDNRYEYDEDMKPDARSWNAVINAVARSRDKDCANRAKYLLDEMGRLYNEGQADLLPDALTFGAIINAYANSFEEGASDKASQLLLHMESLYQLGFENAKPTTFVYNACMNALAKDPLTIRRGAGNELGDSRAGQAEQLLNSMEKRYEEERDYRIMPDCISYSTVINAYANSNAGDSGIRADAILRRMAYRYLLGDTKCRPNAVAYTAAIKANSAAINAIITASSSEKDSALLSVQKTQQMEASARRCEDLLQQLCMLHKSHGNDRSLKPTSVTFDLVIKALTLINDREGMERVVQLREEIAP